MAAREKQTARASHYTRVQAGEKLTRQTFFCYLRRAPDCGGEDDDGRRLIARTPPQYCRESARKRRS